MADTDPVADAPVAKAAKVKTPKKRAAGKATKKPSNHPKYSDMVREAISSLKERGGSSRQAILKYIRANFNVGKEEKPVNNHLKLALKAGVKNGKLKQSKGTGASGSFRLGDSNKAEKKPKAKVAKKKPAAAKAAKAKSPKKVKAKKPAAEKKAKSPKKVKKPKAAKKSPAKAKKAAKPKAAKPKAKKAAKKTPKKAAKK
ncbi:hypothetical protein SNE40_012792 [Patella caerulea]|uniref:H15 domain-containing protein n=1 Tax=Patella caerulea TaxID=87958 RepID=A0AAN8PW25_PATCE